MYKYLLPLLFTLLSFTAYSQEYKDFSSVPRQNGVPTAPGEYYVLVYADWCSPCRALKERLKEYPEMVIYTVNIDLNRNLARQVMGSETYIPTFVKYEIGQSAPVKSVWDRRNLESFMPPKEVEELPPIAEEVYEDRTLNIFSRVLDRIEDSNRSILKEISEIKEERETVFLLLRNIRDRCNPDNITEQIKAENRRLLASLRETLESINNDRQSILDRFSEAAKERSNILSNLAEAAQERRRLLDIMEDFRKSNSELRDSIIEMRRDRQSLFNQIAEIRQERGTLLDSIRDLREDRSTIVSRLDRQERKFRPLVNILDRFDYFFTKLTQSIFYFVMFIVVSISLLLVGFVILLVLLGWVRSKLQKYIPFI